MEGDNIMCDLCEKSILEVEDIQSILGISRNKAYQLVNSGQFHVVRVGRLIKVSRKVFEDWLNGEEVAENA
jgi:excisionase family DNA binding protein